MAAWLERDAGTGRRWVRRVPKAEMAHAERANDRDPLISLYTRPSVRQPSLAYASPQGAKGLWGSKLEFGR